MPTHYLKIDPIYFEQVQKGFKNFELRFNDRGYCLGDYLVLREYLKSSNSYSGKQLKAKVVCIVETADFINDSFGWLILGIQVL
jgi:hypothetical protein